VEGGWWIAGLGCGRFESFFEGAIALGLMHGFLSLNGVFTLRCTDGPACQDRKSQTCRFKDCSAPSRVEFEFNNVVKCLLFKEHSTVQLAIVFSGKGLHAFF
jgi:hypothetical protein